MMTAYQHFAEQMHQEVVAYNDLVAAVGARIPGDISPSSATCTGLHRTVASEGPLLQGLVVPRRDGRITLVRAGNNWSPTGGSEFTSPGHTTLGMLLVSQLGEDKAVSHACNPNAHLGTAFYNAISDDQEINKYLVSECEAEQLTTCHSNQ